MLKLLTLFVIIFNFISYECSYEELIFVIELPSLEKNEHSEFIGRIMKATMDIFKPDTFKKYRLVRLAKDFLSFSRMYEKEDVLYRPFGTYNYQPTCDNINMTDVVYKSLKNVSDESYVVVFTSNAFNDYADYTKIFLDNNINFTIHLMYEVCQNITDQVIDDIASKTKTYGNVFMHKVKSYSTNNRQVLLPLFVKDQDTMKLDLSVTKINRHEKVEIKDPLNNYYNKSSNDISISRDDTNPIAKFILSKPKNGTWIISVSGFSGLVYTNKEVDDELKAPFMYRLVMFILVIILIVSILICCCYCFSGIIFCAKLMIFKKQSG